MGNAELKQGTQPPPRVIKRYSNRKLYDTKESIYVTLLDIAALVRSGEQVQVVDNATKEDKTDVTLALALSEELKANPGEVPVAVLEALVRSRGEHSARMLQGLGLAHFLEASLLAGGAETVGEGGDRDTQGEARGGFRATLDQCQTVLDERIRALLPRPAVFQEQERRLEELTRRVEELEHRLAAEESKKGPGGQE